MRRFRHSESAQGSRRLMKIVGLAILAAALHCAAAAQTYTAAATEIGNERGADGGAFVDFNADGKSDSIVAGEEGCSVVLYLQTSPTVWVEQTVASGMIGPEDAVVADFNADGRKDIAFVNDEAE